MHCLLIFIKKLPKFETRQTISQEESMKYDSISQNNAILGVNIAISISQIRAWKLIQGKYYWFFIEQDGKEKTISFLGGEPFLEFELLKELILYANSKAALYDKRVSYKVATNAILLNEEKIEFLKVHDVELHISINGWKELHNKTRDKSYDTLVPKIQLLHELGYRKEKIIILMVLFPNTINTLKENIESIQQLWMSKIFLEMYIGNKYIWDIKNYRELENNLKEVYDLSIKERNFEIVNFSQKPEKNILIFQHSELFQITHLHFWYKNDRFFSKKYLDTLCQKIYIHHAQ